MVGVVVVTLVVEWKWKPWILLLAVAITTNNTRLLLHTDTMIEGPFLMAICPPPSSFSIMRCGEKKVVRLSFSRALGTIYNACTHSNLFPPWSS